MFDQLVHAVTRLDQGRIEPLLLAAMVIAVSATLAARWPKAPSPLLGVCIALAASQAFRLHEAEVGVAWSPRDVVAILPAGFGLALVASINILVTSRMVEYSRGWRRASRMADADAELGAYGISNVAAVIFGAPLSVGIPARSLANVRCGGATPPSNRFHALVLAGVLGLGSGVLAHIPLAAPCPLPAASSPGWGSELFKQPRFGRVSLHAVFHPTVYTGPNPLRMAKARWVQDSTRSSAPSSCVCRRSSSA
jgi:SulP family sulfate permease